MTDPVESVPGQKEGASDPMDVDIERPHLPHHARHSWLDMSVSFAALFVSFISIFIAWHHGETMKELVRQNERLVQANSLPHLSLLGSNADANGRLEVSLAAANQGVGPAEIETVEVLVDGRPVSRLRELLQACCGDHDYSGILTSTLLGTMIRPGEKVSYLRLPVQSANRAGAVALDEARKADRIETRICYCSVFSDCWSRSSRGNEKPRAVKVCPVPKVQYRE